jgi:hypothetical protein
MSPTQNKPNEKLIEKLKRDAAKRGTASAAFEALEKFKHPAEDVTPQKPSKKVTEQKEDKEQ